MSLALAQHEPRLNDVLGDWATINSDLISVQRTRNLSRHFGETTGSALRSFARTVFEEGSDHRWKALLDSHGPALKRRSQKGTPPKKRAMRARPLEPAALMLRLRLAFGVGIKADTLAFLLSTEQEAWASIGIISAATNYTVAAVRKAALNLVEARFVEQMDDTRAEYHVNHRGWRELLEVSTLPTWRGWAVRFAFVSDFLDWTEAAEVRSMSSYLFESRGLALLRKHEKAFRWQGVARQIPESLHQGGGNQVSEAIHSLTDWMRRVC